MPPTYKASLQVKGQHTSGLAKQSIAIVDFFPEILMPSWLRIYIASILTYFL